MPFIQGRYHINPIAGAALEAARDADQKLSTAEQSAGESRSTNAKPGANGRGGESGAQGPVHRVEIEVAEVVPSHSGRGQRGFVARVHRASAAAGAPSGSTANRDFIDSLTSGGGQSVGGEAQGGRVPTQAPETHVFADPQDLTDFLQGEFQKDTQG